MASSYEKINYRIRPAKCVERKMLIEAWSRLSVFGPLRDYRYIGFGSTFFADFILAHRTLGINKMISIEQDEASKERFEFNKPFRCIDIAYGHACEVLPTLTWNTPSIVWLDYDGWLTEDVLDDVETVITSAPHGSSLVVSVNVQPPTNPDPRTLNVHEFRLRELRERVGSLNVPGDVTGKDLAEWGMAAVCRRVISTTIARTLASRAGGLPSGERLTFQQLFHFRYSDGARMLTVGGVLVAQKDAALLAPCAFEDLGFIRDAEDAYELRVPSLTPREVRHIDRLLPQAQAEGGNPSVGAIPDADIEAYAQIYRYFPMFAETDL